MGRDGAMAVLESRRRHSPAVTAEHALALGELKDNARNDFVETMVKVRSGELPVSHSPAPLAHPASGTLSLPVRVMTDWPTVHVHSATTSPGFQSTPRIAASPTRKVCTYVAVARASLPP